MTSVNVANVINMLAITFQIAYNTDTCNAVWNWSA